MDLHRCDMCSAYLNLDSTECDECVAKKPIKITDIEQIGENENEQEPDCIECEPYGWEYQHQL